MHAQGRPRLARFLAPLALIAFAIAVVMIVSASGVTGDDDSSSDSAGARELPSATDQTNTETTGRKQNRIPATYTIRANDTLSGIAARWGTTVERLQELNPELDPQGLVAGQKIKLRE
ncbi:MAG TPA: LysM domain-containing protein [Thermoleophilaceae bacterium]|nr:LysM domain-containing protein [Thermoleophilaceae bacterium]